MRKIYSISLKNINIKYILIIFVSNLVESIKINTHNNFDCRFFKFYDNTSFIYKWKRKISYSSCASAIAINFVFNYIFIT